MHATTAPTTATMTAHDSAGYLAATLGGVVGALALATAGVMAGAALIPILEDPNGGMENLGLILIPLALGALGILGGMWLGVWAGLQRRGLPGAVATASLTVPLSVGGIFATYGGPLVVVPVLLCVPAAARWMVIHGGAARPPAYPVTIDSSRPTTSSIGGSDAASSAIEREA